MNAIQEILTTGWESVTQFAQNPSGYPLISLCFGKILLIGCLGYFQAAYAIALGLLGVGLVSRIIDGSLTFTESVVGFEFMSRDYLNQMAILATAFVFLEKRAFTHWIQRCLVIAIVFELNDAIARQFSMPVTLFNATALVTTIVFPRFGIVVIAIYLISAGLGLVGLHALIALMIALIALQFKKRELESLYKTLPDQDPRSVQAN